MAALRQLSTRDYSEEARQRLAQAVARARSAAGYPKRPPFAKGRKGFSLRSLEKVEAAEPGVGQEILYAIARALPGWTVDTPKAILEGAKPPQPPDPAVATPPVRLVAEMSPIEAIKAGHVPDVHTLPLAARRILIMQMVGFMDKRDANYSDQDRRNMQEFIRIHDAEGYWLDYYESTEGAASSDVS